MKRVDINVKVTEKMYHGGYWLATSSGRMESRMNTNEVNTNYSSVQTDYSAYKNTAVSNKNDNTDKVTDKKNNTSNNSSSGVVYESTNIKNMSKEDRTALVQKLKADADARVANLKSLVEKMFLKQSEKASFASDTDMWRFLASGDFTVDAETKAAAQEAISEDGYWGVEQTSQRIFDMAVALSGGESGQMDKMLEAFKKGFKQATDTWGKELPDISQKTYAAVMEKFENYKNENAAATENTNA